MKIIQGDALTELKKLPAGAVQCCVTSPPYWGLRDYGVPGQLGLEKTPEEYVEKVAEIFQEVKRVLRGDGTLWLNLGDSYIANKTGSGGDHTIGLSGGRKAQIEAQKRPDKKAAGLKPKDMVGIPWRVAFALQADGWYLRSDIIWSKPNPMPESVKDRPTKSHEYIFLLSKSEKYYYDSEAVREPYSENSDHEYRVQLRKKKRYNIQFEGHAEQTGLMNQKVQEGRNRRTVWEMNTKPYPGAHFATFPEELPRICILAGSKPGDIILDNFGGSGTTGAVAEELGREYWGIELNPEYVKLHDNRISQTGLGL